MSWVTIEKVMVTAVLVAWWLLMPLDGGHLTYWLCHANVWHLACNVFVLWMLRGPRLYMALAVALAVACSYLPAWNAWGGTGVTVGFSGVLFAIIGVEWGVACRRGGVRRRNRAIYRTFVLKAVPLAAVGMVIPHVNGCLHLWCLLTGFAVARYAIVNSE